MENIRKWSEKDIQFLKDNYFNKGAKYCSISLRRTLYAIRRRARTVGIANINGHYARGNYQKQNIVLAVENSKSITDVIKYLGLRTAGGNYAVIKKYIKLYGIDTSHFTPQSEIIKIVVDRFVRKPLSEILIKNKFNLCSSSVKERLYKEGLKKRKCELCGQEEIWMGKRMSLILDHKNGIHSDWRIENLRIVCPNCNATLDTHCGKNNIKKKCTKCNIQIKHKGKFCRNCYGEELQGKPKFNTRKVKNRPDEKQLFKDINELGYCGTGRKYGVSDNAIRKWLKMIK